METQSIPKPKVPLSSFVMDVVSPPQTTEKSAPPPKESGPVPEKPKKQDSKKHEAKPDVPKKSTGVGLAIFATVVIVLGLAALATYAYLKTVQ